MRFDELSLRIPGDELRVRFHERLTVLSGISALERQGMIDGLLGTLTGSGQHETVLTYIDSMGRRVGVTRGRDGNVVHTHENGDPAPDPIARLDLDATALEELCCIRPGDLGLLALVASEAAPPELIQSRAALDQLTQELDAAIAAQQSAETVRERLEEIDERLREAEDGAAKRAYARLLADLERVRAEYAAVRGGEMAAETDRRFISGAREVAGIVERWRRADEWLREARGRFGGRERLDARTLAETLAVPDTVPEHLDMLVSRLDGAEARRDRLAARLQELAAARLPEPSHPAIVRLARIDQDEVWDSANRVLETGLRLEQASLDLGGLPAEGTVSTLAESLERSHQRLEDAERLVESRRRPTILTVSISLIAACAALVMFRLLAPVPLLAASVAAMWGFAVPRRALSKARGEEEDCLVKAGIGTYLGFQIRRIDATIDPGLREQLNVCALQHRAALSAWHDIAGELDAEDALSLEDEVRQYAKALGDLSGAADEIEAVRGELVAAAEPAASAALRELMDACAPYGVDDPKLAAAMVRHQVDAGRTARLQKELEAAEQAESQVAEELVVMLGGLGFADGDVNRRIAALEIALSASIERETARTVGRRREDIQSEMAELEARAKREYQPEWGSSVVAASQDEPDIEELTATREELARTYEQAIGLLPDVAHLADRHNAVERRVTVLEAAMGDSPAAAALVDPVDIERYLQARVTSVRSLGSEVMPLLLDDPFLRIRGERKWELLELVERLSNSAQLVYLSDDPDVLLWSRRRLGSGTLRLLEPAADQSAVDALGG